MVTELTGQHAVDAAARWAALAPQLARFLGALAGPMLAGCEPETPPAEVVADTEEPTPATDDDGDGYVEPDDCDDDNADVNPGVAADPCNGLDDDCDGSVDNGDPAVTTTCVESDAKWYIQERDLPHHDGAGAASIAGDLDGDGLSDVLFGGASEDEGGLHLFLAAEMTEGVVTTRDARWQLVGVPGDYLAGGALGMSAGARFVPDLDGDGRSEVVVGRSVALGEPGGAYVVRAADLDAWSGNVLITNVAWSLITAPPTDASGVGRTVEALGDVGGDGGTDLLVSSDLGPWILAGESIVAGSTDLTQGLFIELPYDYKFMGLFAAAAAGPTGDVDGDGLADVAIPCMICRSHGAILVFLGNSLPASGTVNADAADVEVQGIEGQVLGDAFAGDADIDGDGLPDWAVAATQVGVLGGGFVFLDTPSLVGLTLSSEDATAQAYRLGETDEDLRFGVSMALADLDGDVSADLVVQDGGDNLLLYAFSAEQLSQGGTWESRSAFRVYGRERPLSASGGSMFGGGEVNGDGVGDFLLVDGGWDPQGYRSGYGAMFVFDSADQW